MKHTCGDAGGRVFATGEPCQQTTAPGKLCIWHGSPPAARSLLALKGRLKQRERRELPSGTPAPNFATREDIVRWAEEMAGRVLRGELDPKLSAEARGHAQLALAARTAEAQEKLVEALLRVEHGGAAVALLARLQEGLGDSRRRLPPPVRAIPAPPGGDPA
ncbi:MAG TPA: hypothetical protein VNM66_02780 [Thermodesulfobacteriota bacterium]|nr:hypothetical protein [Thermodesulfobacteriota bacterium]